jgi:hypothetical protein
MTMILKIYLAGCLVALAYGIRIMKEGKYVSLGDLAFSLVFCTLSWITVFAYWVGQNSHRQDSDNMSGVQ